MLFLTHYNIKPIYLFLVIDFKSYKKCIDLCFNTLFINKGNSYHAIEQKIGANTYATPIIVFPFIFFQEYLRSMDVMLKVFRILVALIINKFLSYLA